MDTLDTIIAEINDILLASGGATRQEVRRWRDTLAALRPAAGEAAPKVEGPPREPTEAMRMQGTSAWNLGPTATWQLMWDAWHASAQVEAQLSTPAAAPAPVDGMVLVPREPTQEMIRAGLDCQDADPADGSDTELFYAYKAMISAAPTREATPAEQGDECPECGAPVIDLSSNPSKCIYRYFPQAAPVAAPSGVDALPAKWRKRADSMGASFNLELYRCADELTAALAQPDGARSFQSGVEAWMAECFIPSLYSNMTERGDRLLEETLELLQSNGYDRNRVPTLVDYVYGRPLGQPQQEVGGVMVTLAGYCWIAGIDMQAEAARELARITQPAVMAKIRAKQEAKNALHFDTPLPGQPDGARMGGEDLFYMQDTRQYVGNCPMWWAKDRQGYTTRLDLAHRFTREDAMKQAGSRESDVAWPCEAIDAIQRPTVDMQDMRRLDRLAAAPSPAEESQP